MDWLDEVNIKQKKKNQILFTKDSTYLQDLVTLFQKQDHRVMILWAFDFAAESIAKLEAAYPEEKRPREALEAARAWGIRGFEDAYGTTKNFRMPCLCKKYFL